MNPRTDAAAGRSRTLARAALIVAFAALAYSPLPRNGFILMDDAAIVYQNAAVTAGLGRAAVEHAFSNQHYFQPLAFISLATDRSLFGLDPRAFHAVNWSLHVATALLVFFALKGTAGALAATAAATVFAAHPINVEAVAWAAERRTVLAGLFGVASCVAWVSWVRSRRIGAYVAALGAFALSLLAKPMLVPLPLMLLALDVWPLRRVGGEARPRWWPLLLEKAPFAVLSGASAVLTLATSARMPAHVSRGIGLRAANAVTAVFQQLGHLVFPSDLTIFYPYPEQPPAAWPFALAALIGVTVACVRVVARAPWWLAGWCWFLAALLPTLGFRQAGWWPAFADRHAYVAALGPVAAVCVQLDAWLGPRRAGIRRFAGASLTAAGLLLAGLAARQVTFWRDGVTLLTRAVAYAPEDLDLHYYLGDDLAQRGDYRAAQPHLERAALGCADPRLVCSNPSEMFTKLSVVLGQTERPDEALHWARLAVEIEPNSPEALFNLARTLHATGRLPEALAFYEAFVRVAPPRMAAYRDAAAETLRLARPQPR